MNFWSIYAATLPIMFIYIMGKFQHNLRTWSAWILYVVALTIVWPLLLAAQAFETLGAGTEEEEKQ